MQIAAIGVESKCQNQHLGNHNEIEGWTHQDDNDVSSDGKMNYTCLFLEIEALKGAQQVPLNHEG